MNDVQTGTGFALIEDDFSVAEMSGNGVIGKEREFVFRETGKDWNLGQDFAMRGWFGHAGIVIDVYALNVTVP